jgi:hypothetical protein
MHPFQERALNSGIKLRIDRGAEPLPSAIEIRGIVQVMMYPLDHAIYQTPSGGLVWVRLRASNGNFELFIHHQDPEMTLVKAANLRGDE